MSAGGGKSSSRGHGDVIPPFPGERQRALARRNYIVLLALVLVAAGLSVSVAYWGWRAPGIPTDFQAVWTIDEPRSDGVVPHLGVSAADEAPGPRALRFEGEGWTETVRVSATGVVEGAEPGARRLIFSLPGPSIGALFSGSERVRGDLR
ncbi:MAG: hypothetical protein KC466_10750, partial [Myxococcales bacterium]|nr:hypothetical protein [Myxococcales bacterium]